MSRAHNGLWNGPKGIRYRRVSGVIVAPDVNPWTYAVRDIALYHNPWAYTPVSPDIILFRQLMAKEATMTPIEGKHPREILGLPEGWPGFGPAS
jgi:hypothetical protein